MKRRREAVEKAFKTFMRQALGARKFSVLHHTSVAHACLQAADYCTWAVHRKWRDGELRPYRTIKAFLRSEFDIFASGSATYH